MRVPGAVALVHASPPSNGYVPDTSRRWPALFLLDQGHVTRERVTTNPRIARRAVLLRPTLLACCD
jgi:hypothetical protein